MCGTITVQGIGKVVCQADRAKVHVCVSSEAKTAALAIQQNSTDVNELISVLVKGGVEKRYIRTSNFGVRPTYKSGMVVHSKIDKWRVDNTVALTLIDVGIMGSILALAGERGAINGLNFYHSGINDLTDKARAAAVLDAKRRASAYCETAELTLNGVKKIEENAHQSHWGNATQSLCGAGVTQEDDFFIPTRDVPVEQGETEVEVGINITFKTKCGSECKDACACECSCKDGS